jgi:hypothetical protein
MRPRIVLFALLLLGSSQVCAAPGADLVGKSVVVSWTESRQQRVNGSEVRPVTRNFELQIYISAAGRPFARLNNSGRGGTQSNEQVGGEGQSQGGGTRAIRVDGNSITLQANYGNYARNLRIEVAPGGGGCTAQMSVGKEAGSSPKAFRNVAGHLVEIHSLSVSGVACSLRQGNVFGG